MTFDSKSNDLNDFVGRCYVKTACIDNVKSTALLGYKKCEFPICGFCDSVVNQLFIWANLKHLDRGWGSRSVGECLPSMQ